MPDNILLSAIPLPELVNVLREMVREELRQSQSEALKEKYLTAAEVMASLNISRPTLIEWSKKGYLTQHRIGGRVYYKNCEVSEGLERVKNIKQKMNGKGSGRS